MSPQRASPSSIFRRGEIKFPNPYDWEIIITQYCCWLFQRNTLTRSRSHPVRKRGGKSKADVSAVCFKSGITLPFQTNTSETGRSRAIHRHHSLFTVQCPLYTVTFALHTALSSPIEHGVRATRMCLVTEPVWVPGDRRPPGVNRQQSRRYPDPSTKHGQWLAAHMTPDVTRGGKGAALEPGPCVTENIVNLKTVTRLVRPWRQRWSSGNLFRLFTSISVQQACAHLAFWWRE